MDVSVIERTWTLGMVLDANEVLDMMEYVRELGDSKGD